MEISFKDILRIIKKNIVFIVIVSLLFSVCSFFITNFFIKKTYTATVKLYVTTDYKNSNSGVDLSAYNYSSKLVATYIDSLTQTISMMRFPKHLRANILHPSLNQELLLQALKARKYSRQTLFPTVPPRRRT